LKSDYRIVFGGVTGFFCVQRLEKTMKEDTEYICSTHHKVL